jgi:hypothetical protein
VACLRFARLRRAHDVVGPKVHDHAKCPHPRPSHPSSKQLDHLAGDAQQGRTVGQDALIDLAEEVDDTVGMTEIVCPVVAKETLASEQMKTIKKARVLLGERDVLVQAVLRVHAADHLDKIAPDGGADANVASDVHRTLRQWPRRPGAPRTRRERADGSMSPWGVTRITPGEPTARESPPLPSVAESIVDSGTIAPQLVGSAGVPSTTTPAPLGLVLNDGNELVKPTAFTPAPPFQEAGPRPRPQ